MAIQLECINLIIPIKTIEEKYSGGWQQFLSNYGDIGTWYDEHLFRVGAMNPMDIHLMLEKFENLGFTLYKGNSKNPKKWVDVCVVPSSVPCDWLDINGDTASFKGTNMSFPPSVIEQIGYYVYSLADANNKIFYIGKGQGNRVFNHFYPSNSNDNDDFKVKNVASPNDVKITILRHGLTESEAFAVEATLIDYINIDNLQNKVRGQGSDKGVINVNDLIIKYAVEPLEFSEPAILIILNELFIDEEDLYKRTRGDWVIGQRKDNIKFVFSVYNSIVRQVYEVEKWEFAEGHQTNRWRFIGKKADNFQHLVGKSVKKFLTQGSQNPIRYI